MTDFFQNVEQLRKRKIILILTLVTIAAIVFQTLVLQMLNKRTAKNTLNMLENQVEIILDKNAEQEENLVDSLKEEYILRAKAVAYYLDAKPEVEDDAEELKELAILLQIDEINIFDETGTIVAGSAPEYYGLTMDAGEQIAFFLPMLDDKSLTLCQDMTPNTAEGKSMMYAAVWNAAGTEMVQIGITPVRLVEELNNNDISTVIANMPAYSNYEVYVTDGESQTILGSTSDVAAGVTLSEIGLNLTKRAIGKSGSTFTYMNGKPVYYVCQKYGDYLILVTHSVRTDLGRNLFILFIELTYLIIAAYIIFQVVSRLIQANGEKNKQLEILRSVADTYYSMHLIDLKKDTQTEYRAQGGVKQVVDHQQGATEMMRKVMTLATTVKYREYVLEFTELTTLAERMKNKKTIAGEFIGTHLGWTRMEFITLAADREGRPTKVMFITQDIDEQRRREEDLVKVSNTDELTGLLNRHAYEAAFETYRENGLPEDLVYIAFDVNGLKNANDTLGHEAGDELIVGAAKCMKKCFSSYGKIYRTGGDEYVALIRADKEELVRLKEEFIKITSSWTGERVEGLTVSTGYVTVEDPEEKTIRAMSLLADKKMYEDKSNYYRQKGMDRRGQKDAHNALCALYTKILKVNLTEDSYEIVNMDESEKTEEKGFEGSIYAWLKEFALTGQVKEQDLPEYLKKTDPDYLREYFKEGKKSLKLTYFRKVGEEYRKVQMEMIPAREYTDEDQKIYLYVKDIDEE